LVFHSGVAVDVDWEGVVAMMVVVDTNCLHCAWVEVVVVDNHESFHCPWSSYYTLRNVVLRSRPLWESANLDSLLDCSYLKAWFHWTLLAFEAAEAGTKDARLAVEVVVVVLAWSLSH
jgi:hypothetical protein